MIVSPGLPNELGSPPHLRLSFGAVNGQNLCKRCITLCVEPLQAPESVQSAPGAGVSLTYPVGVQEIKNGRVVELQ